MPENASVERQPANEAEQHNLAPVRGSGSSGLEGTIKGMSDANLGRLYRYSGLVDSLRDTAHALTTATSTPGQSTVTGMASMYNALRTAVADVLNEHVGEDTLTWTPVLADTASVDEVYVAAAQLARWADVVHQTPKFILAEQAARAGMDSLAAKLGQEVPELSSETTPRSGLYL